MTKQTEAIEYDKSIKHYTAPISGYYLVNGETVYLNAGETIDRDYGKNSETDSEPKA